MAIDIKTRSLFPVRRDKQIAITSGTITSLSVEGGSAVADSSTTLPVYQDASLMIYYEASTNSIRINANLYASGEVTAYTSNPNAPSLWEVLRYVKEASLGTTLYWSVGKLEASGTGGGSSQWTTTGSDIYFANKVKIGNTAAPTTTLDIVGDVSIYGNIRQYGYSIKTGGIIIPLSGNLWFRNPDAGDSFSDSGNRIKIFATGGHSYFDYYDNLYFRSGVASSATKITITNAGGATFAGAISASNLSGTNTGDQTSVSGSSGSCTGNSATATYATSAGSITSQANSATITSATTATANTIVLRDSGADIYVRYAHTSYCNSSDDTSSTGITYLMAKFGDNYHRSASAAKVASFISGQTMNIAGSSSSCTGNAATATALQTARSIGGVSFNGTADITVASATGGFAVSGGNLTCTGEVTSYYSSDEKLKYNINSFTALDIIKNIFPITYKWNEKAKKLNPSKDDRNNFGIIAQDLELLLPELIHPIYDGEYKSIDYIQLIPILIQAVKEQQIQINDLKKCLKQ